MIITIKDPDSGREVCFQRDLLGSFDFVPAESEIEEDWLTLHVAGSEGPVFSGARAREVHELLKTIFSQKKTFELMRKNGPQPTHD